MSNKTTLKEFELKCDLTFDYLYKIIIEQKPYSKDSNHFLAFNPDIYTEVNKIMTIFKGFHQFESENQSINPFFSLYIQNLRPFCEFCLRQLCLISLFHFYDSKSDIPSIDKSDIFITVTKKYFDNDIYEAMEGTGLNKCTLDKLIKKIFNTPPRSGMPKFIEIKIEKFPEPFGTLDLTNKLVSEVIEESVTARIINSRDELGLKSLIASDSLIHGNPWEYLRKQNLFEDKTKKYAIKSLVTTTNFENYIYPTWAIDNIIGKAAYNESIVNVSLLRTLLNPVIEYLVFIDLFAEKVDYYFIPMNDLVIKPNLDPETSSE